MSSSLETLLSDVAARLADTGQLTIDERLALVIELVQTQVHQPMLVCEVRCAVFSRSALFHLGGAMVPTTPGEVEQFREQARGGFVQVGTDEQPHRVLRVGAFVLDPAHVGALQVRRAPGHPASIAMIAVLWITRPRCVAHWYRFHRPCRSRLRSLRTHRPAR